MVQKKSDDFLEGLRSMIQVEVQAALANLKPHLVIDSKYPSAPIPVLKGKKFENSERQKLSIMVDKVLLKCLQTAGIETGRSYSELVNAALWFYFQKPILSFQKKETK